MYAPNNVTSISLWCISLKLTGIIYAYLWTPGGIFSMIQIPRWLPNGNFPVHVKFHSRTVSPLSFGNSTQNFQGLVISKQAPTSLNLSSIRYLIWPPSCCLVFPVVWNTVHAQYLYFHLAVWLKALRDRSPLKRYLQVLIWVWSDIKYMATSLSFCISWDEFSNSLLAYCLETYRGIYLYSWIPGCNFQPDPNSKKSASHQNIKAHEPLVICDYFWVWDLATPVACYKDVIVNLSKSYCDNPW